MFYNNTLIYPWFLEFSSNERDIIKKFFELINLGLEKLQLPPKSDVTVEIELLCFVYSDYPSNNHLLCEVITERMMELIERVIEKENAAIKPLCWSKINIHKQKFPITITLENNFNGGKEIKKYSVKIRSKDNILTEKIYKQFQPTKENFKESYL
ncbi:MAG: hypothetical protein ACOZAJ_03580 [Patescibacteria group bacterium]